MKIRGWERQWAFRVISSWHLSFSWTYLMAKQTISSSRLNPVLLLISFSRLAPQITFQSYEPSNIHTHRHTFFSLLDPDSRHEFDSEERVRKHWIDKKNRSCSWKLNDFLLEFLEIKFAVAESGRVRKLMRSSPMLLMLLSKGKLIYTGKF